MIIWHELCWKLCCLLCLAQEPVPPQTEQGTVNLFLPPFLFISVFYTCYLSSLSKSILYIFTSLYILLILPSALWEMLPVSQSKHSSWGIAFFENSSKLFGSVTPLCHNQLFTTYRFISHSFFAVTHLCGAFPPDWDQFFVYQKQS